MSGSGVTFHTSDGDLVLADGLAAAAFPPVVADRRLWMDADRSVLVEDGDDGAAFLVAAAGQRIPADVCAELRLVSIGGIVVQQDSPEAERLARRAQRPRGGSGQTKPRGGKAKPRGGKAKPAAPASPPAQVWADPAAHEPGGPSGPSEE